MEHLFRLDPAASFDNEIARVSDELDVDVVFGLVPREDRPMDNCWVHRQDHRREAIYTVTMDGPNGFHKEVGACHKHGPELATALTTGDYERFKQDADPKRAELIINAAARPDMTIDVAKNRSAPDLGRNSMGLRTPADQPPPDRSPPSHDWDR